MPAYTRPLRMARRADIAASGRTRKVDPPKDRGKGRLATRQGFGMGLGLRLRAAGMSKYWINVKNRKHQPLSAEGHSLSAR
jgi:hypothetical protein